MLPCLSTFELPVSVLTGGVTANGFQWMIQGNGEANVHAVCQWWPHHCFYLLTPSTLLLCLCVWRDSIYVYGFLCMYILILLQPDCFLVGVRILWTLNFELWQCFLGIILLHYLTSFRTIHIHNVVRTASECTYKHNIHGGPCPQTPLEGFSLHIYHIH